jgi:hypothetical protein
MEGLGKSDENFRQDSRYPGRASSWQSFERNLPDASWDT